MPREFKVRLEVFEGPLDLLLYLVRKQEVDIYDVSIERITKEYLGYIEAFRMLDLDVAGEFIAMAANLIYIKSRTLLPVSQQPPEDEADEEDPRWELIRQLVEYKKFKDAAGKLQMRERERERLFARLPEKPEEAAGPSRLAGEVGIFDLIHAFQNVLARLDEKKEDLREIFEENFTVSEKMDVILERIGRAPSVRFEDLFRSAASRAEIVVTFLALLELIRLKQVTARQTVEFGEIHVLPALADLAPVVGSAAG